MHRERSDVLLGELLPDADLSLLLFLRAEISKGLGYEVSASRAPGKVLDHRVDISVEELHGTLSGAARLVASWRIMGGDGAEELAAFRFARTRPLAQDGYPALADAEIALIGELAVAIANSLAEVGKDSPSASAN